MANLSVEFLGPLPACEMELAVERIKTRVKAAYPQVTALVIKLQRSEIIIAGESGYWMRKKTAEDEPSDLLSVRPIREARGVA